MAPPQAPVVFAFLNSGDAIIWFSIVYVVILISVLLAGFLLVLHLLKRSGNSNRGDPNTEYIQTVETDLAFKDKAQHVNTGFVTAVTPETRRFNKRHPFRSSPKHGIRITISILISDKVEPASPGDTEVELWFEIPPALGNNSKLEQFCQYQEVPVEKPTDLLGQTVPVRFNEQGQWETEWVADWRRQQPLRNRLRPGRVLRERGRWNSKRAEDDS